LFLFKRRSKIGFVVGSSPAVHNTFATQLDVQRAELLSLQGGHVEGRWKRRKKQKKILLLVLVVVVVVAVDVGIVVLAGVGTGV